MDHAAKLRGAFDALSVDFRHYVIFLEAGLGRGTVRNDLSQEHAALGRKFQLLGLVGGHFVCLDAEPTRTVAADHRIKLIIFDAWQDFDPRGLLIFYDDSLPRLLERVRVSEFGHMILPVLKLRLQFCLQLIDPLLQPCDRGITGLLRSCGTGGQCHEH